MSILADIESGTNFYDVGQEQTWDNTDFANWQASAFSTPVQSPTPTPSGNDFFSNIITGVGSALSSAIPQFTTELVKGGAQKLLGNNSTFKGNTGVPTTAQQPASLLSNPIVLIGGLAVVALIAYIAFKD